MPRHVMTLLATLSVLACAGTAADAQPFKGYSVEKERPNFLARVVTVQGSGSPPQHARLGKPQLFMTSVALSSAPPGEPAYRVCYRLTHLGLEPLPAMEEEEIDADDSGHPHETDVIVTTQLGQQLVQLSRARMLCLPAVQTPADTTWVSPGTIPVAGLLCHRARIWSTLTDALDGPRSTRFAKGHSFCTPAMSAAPASPAGRARRLRGPSSAT